MKRNTGLDLLLGVGAALLSSSAARAQVQFVNRAPDGHGVSFGRGAAMIDLDQDGLPDVIAANAAMDNFFLRQTPTHGLQQANDLWDVPYDGYLTQGVLAADFDNDGDPDVYLLRNGPANLMLRNDIGSEGRLTDVSAQAGAGGTLATRTFGGTALDFDRDGFLDVFLSNVDQPCSLLRNDGTTGLYFEDVSSQAGIVSVGTHRHAGAGDIDNDGWIDVGVGNENGPNLLYANDTDGTFTDVAAETGVLAPQSSFGTVFEDFNNDGWQDVLLPKYQTVAVEPSGLFLNTGSRTFVDVSESSGIGGHQDMGHDVFDVDLDGYADLYFGTGTPAAPYDDVLMLVRPTGTNGVTCMDATAECGLLAEGPTRMHGMAHGDFDLDGDLDVYCNNGGPTNNSATLQENFLWESMGNGNSWIGLRLEGVQSNRSAIGARASVFTTGGFRVFRHLTAGRGYANTPEPTLFFGLGSETTVDRVEIEWPSGIRQVIVAPPTGTLVSVLETGMRVRPLRRAGEPVETLRPPAPPPSDGVSEVPIGSSLTLELCGPPGDQVDVWYGLRKTSVDGPWTGGVGGIHRTRALGTTRLDPSGRGTLRLPIPPSPVLVDRLLYFQSRDHSGSGPGLLSPPVAARLTSPDGVRLPE